MRKNWLKISPSSKSLWLHHKPEPMPPQRLTYANDIPVDVHTDFRELVGQEMVI